MPKSRWHQDVEVAELIEYFNQPEKYEDWAGLSADEYRTIEQELQKCRLDFIYAARNYFWISNKQLGDQLFSLWPTQELILEKILELKAKGLPQKLLIIKARQLGCSTLIEALIAWRTMFFQNVNALVVSTDRDHAADVLYPIMQFILDRMPWWLQPMTAMRKSDTGLWFANPDENSRKIDPGQNSRIYVKGATSTTGVGQGIRLSAVHCSEFCLDGSVLVHCSDGLVKPIRDVHVGDVVTTSSGLHSVVTRWTLTERHNEATSEVHTWGSFSPLITTKDHRILTPSGYQPAETIAVGDYVRMPVREVTSSLTHFSYTYTPRGRSSPATTSLPANFELGWLFGMYLAEGTVRMDPRQKQEFQCSHVQFALSKGEGDEFAQRASAALGGQRITITPLRIRGAETNGVVARLCNSGFARLVNEVFGSVETKRLPDVVWEYGREFCEGIICGYLEGDGAFSTKHNKISAHSIRLGLTVQMRSLAASLGWGWTCIDHAPAGFRYGRNCKDTYVWRLGVDQAQSPRMLLGREQIPFQKSTTRKWRYSDDGRFIDIRVENVTEGYAENLYDISVESEDHSFCTLQCCVHNCDWEDGVAKSIIDEDMVNALVESADTFAILESTAKGANRYAHRLWKRNVELEDECEWHPLFFPWFFEASRIRVPLPGWKIDQHEQLMRERIEKEWVRCDDYTCRQFHARYIHTFDRAGANCHTCGTGILKPYILTDDQSAWMQHRRKNAAKDDDSIKKLRQEICATAEESFQISGYQIFGDHAQEWANFTVESPKFEGFFDPVGNFHACNMNSPNADTSQYYAPCILVGCSANHWWDVKPLKIWELPIAGQNYVCGADVAEGLGGKADYSVGTILRIANRAGAADYQVATWRSNVTDPIQFAYELNHLGRMYNDALMSIEVNKYDTTGTYVRFQLQYPNIYRWKTPDSMNVLSNKLGWVTNVSSRPRLWQHLKRWLDSHLIFIRSKNAVEEMKNFVKDDYDDSRAGADREEHDDELIGLMISLYTGHECEYSDALGMIPVQSEISPETAKYNLRCMTCNHKWPANSMPISAPEPDAGEIRPPERCPNCTSMLIEVNRNLQLTEQRSMDPMQDLLEGVSVVTGGESDYRNY